MLTANLPIAKMALLTRDMSLFCYAFVHYFLLFIIYYICFCYHIFYFLFLGNKIIHDRNFACLDLAQFARVGGKCLFVSLRLHVMWRRDKVLLMSNGSEGRLHILNII